MLVEMTGPDSNRVWQQVDDPGAAKLLLNPTWLRYLEPFLAAEMTVSEAAAQLGVDFDAMWYRTRRLRQHGLISVVYQKQRSGSAVKHYRAVADGFFVPYRSVSAATLEELQAPIDDAYNRLLFRSILRALHTPSLAELGARITLDTRGKLWVDSAWDVRRPVEPELERPDGPAAWASWHDLFLDFEDAKVLQDELTALWRRYEEKRGTQRYLLRLGLAPVMQE